MYMKLVLAHLELVLCFQLELVLRVEVCLLLESQLFRSHQVPFPLWVQLKCLVHLSVLQLELRLELSVFLRNLFPYS